MPTLRKIDPSTVPPIENESSSSSSTPSSWSSIVELELEPPQHYQEPTFASSNSTIGNDFKTLYARRLNCVSIATVGAGLDNLGNSCFLSSILQCFTHTVPLVQGLLPSSYHACDHGFCVVCTLREHVENSISKSGTSFSPSKFFDNLNYFSPSFVRNQQEDAHEFMQCALNKLRRCFPGGERNLVEQVFGGLLVSTLRCRNCGHTSDTYEPVIDLSVDIEEMDTLQHALESFTKVEQIDALFRCDNCRQLVCMEKQLKLDQPPLIAAFHLKRFKKFESFVEKNVRDVNFTLELDLLPYTSGNGNDNKELLKYDLYAVVEHMGVSPDSGHYICHIRSAPDHWHEMNDHRIVKRVEVLNETEEFVLSREAYLLFYARRGTPWFSSIMEDVHSDVKSDEDYESYSNDEKGDDDIVEAPSVSDSKCNVMFNRKFI